MRLVEFPRKIDSRSMREMAAHAEIESQNFVAGLKHRETNRSIGLRTAMRLHIGIFTIKNLFKSVDGELFGLVHDFTSSIITTAGIALRVLVGHDISHGLHHLQGGKIFRRNQFNTMPL